MQTLTCDMPLVPTCTVTKCVYNKESKCHARAITVGDLETPACDTFIENSDNHIKNAERMAGVGACKVIGCKFNDDFECVADEINVAFVQNSAMCKTYSPRR